MPFKAHRASPLTIESVERNAPRASGVYGISNASGAWIYIGESADLQQALLDHLRDEQTPILKRQPTGFAFELRDRSTCSHRLNQLVLEYEPVCNRHGKNNETNSSAQSLSSMAAD